MISPSPPPPPSGSTYTFNVIAEGVLSDFDDAKKNKIKGSIAAKAGVSEKDVYIQIRAASVDIVVQIKVSDYASVAKKVDSYLTSASQRRKPTSTHGDGACGASQARHKRTTTKFAGRPSE